MAGTLDSVPTDLSRSTAALPELMRIIDGRRTVRAHGTGDMPVWGEVFVAAREGDSRQHRQTLRDVRALAEYVLSLRSAAR